MDQPLISNDYALDVAALAIAAARRAGCQAAPGRCRWGVAEHERARIQPGGGQQRWAGGTPTARDGP